MSTGVKLVVLLLMSGGQCSGFDFLELLLGPRLNHFEERSSPNTADYKTTERLVKKFGYRLDTHLVASETGHILTLHRIPRGRRSGNFSDQTKRPIAFIHHGLLGCSDMWLARGPQHDLSYLLADFGYDVWLFNIRGNTYSRKHKVLNPNSDASYWDFGIDEIGYYDLPATIDYVLNITEQKNVFFIGHSIGCSTAFIMCSSKPQYNDKIRLLVALGPVANVKHKLSPFASVSLHLALSILNMATSTNIYEVLPRREHSIQMLQTLCKDGSPTQGLCLLLTFALEGPDMKQLNTTLFSEFFSYYPGGTSAKLLVNCLQYYITGRFSKFDYNSPMLNMLHYNGTKPPLYELAKITAPVFIFHGEGDFLVPPEDVNNLATQLPNIIGKITIPYKYFNHLDFILAINARSLLYEDILRVINKYR